MRAFLILCVVGGHALADPQAPADAFLAAYDRDAKAQAIAKQLFESYGHVTTAGDDEKMDGGYRGTIHLVPQLPIAKYRQQLIWVAAALDAIDAFYSELAPDKPSYRWRDLTIKFVRSVNKRTPSAYATGWTITHNVVGSLLTSERGVRETYVHELFHLNDFAHGNWSGRTLTADYAAIVEKCGTKATCLAPYAPGDTKVRATGTYYAFQPNNGDGVHEYAAELAVRYFREQSEMRTRGALSRAAFKCGPPENARAWKAMVDEFFAGRDLVAACSEATR